MQPTTATMRCLYISGLVLSSIVNCFCQNINKLSEATGKFANYKFIIEAPLFSCDILGNTGDSAILAVAEPGAVFTIVGQTDNDSLIIRFWVWKDKPILNNELCFADSLCMKRKYFLLAASDLDKKAVLRYNTRLSFTAGTVLIPVKIRLQKFDFSKDFTVGSTAGIKCRLSPFLKNYINFLLGVGISSVTLDYRSTNGIIEDTFDVPALTPSLGCVFDFNNTQAGIFLGSDYITNNEEYNFIYHGKLWLSFGMGFTILSQQSEVAEAERKQ